MVAFPCCLATGQAALDLCFCLLCSVSAAERRSSNSRVCNQRISLIAEWLCMAELSHTLSPRVRRRKHNLRFTLRRGCDCVHCSEALGEPGQASGSEDGTVTRIPSPLRVT